MIDGDADLVARARGGDRAAFEELVRRHADRLYAVVLRMVGDNHDAEEVTQEAFVRAWRAIGRFKGDSQFFTWLYRIGVNEARRRGDRGQRGVLRGIRSLDLEPIDPPDPSESPHSRAERADLRRALEEAVRSLPHAYRAPLILRDVEGLSTAQAATIIGIGEAAFKSRLHRARLAVRDAVRAYLAEDDR
ncbi:MAG: RNA polymerase sigma factor [Thermoleophilaceae bacterium]